MEISSISIVYLDNTSIQMYFIKICNVKKFQKIKQKITCRFLTINMSNTQHKISIKPTIKKYWKNFHSAITNKTTTHIRICDHCYSAISDIHNIFRTMHSQKFSKKKRPANRQCDIAPPTPNSTPTPNTIALFHRVYLQFTLNK